MDLANGADEGNNFDAVGLLEILFRDGTSSDTA